MQTLGLTTSAEHYNYLNQSGCYTNNGWGDDAKEYQLMRQVSCGTLLNPRQEMFLLPYDSMALWTACLYERSNSDDADEGNFVI